VRRILGALLLCLGGILAVAALLLLGDAVSAWIERLQYGSGLMFADAEVFFVLGLAIGATGGARPLGRAPADGAAAGRTRIDVHRSKLRVDCDVSIRTGNNGRNYAQRFWPRGIQAARAGNNKDRFRLQQEEVAR